MTNTALIRPAWTPATIALMVIGFMVFWPLGLAMLAYIRVWLKVHRAAEFYAALLNNQPMGFYRPAQIVRDAEEHGVAVRPIDVNHSGWDCTLEDGGDTLRLGMRLTKGLRETDAGRITGAVRERGPFNSIQALWRASGASVGALQRLAAADAFGSMGLDRRGALWSVQPLRDTPLPLFEQADAPDEEGGDALPETDARARVLHDYGSTGLSLKAHPVSFIRAELDRRGVTPAAELRSDRLCPQGRRVSVAGVVLVRQRPGTASGVVFITLEDETGIANLVVWPKVYERFRRVVRLSRCLLVRGRVEREGEVVHVHADQIEGIDTMLGGLAGSSRDFH